MTITKEVTECANACSSTAAICKECASACKEKGGMETCATFCRDCATVCEQHAKNLLEGDHTKADLCITTCVACAAECVKFPNMAICVRCAESCQSCATACKQAEKVKA